MGKCRRCGTEIPERDGLCIKCIVDESYEKTMKEMRPRLQQAELELKREQEEESKLTPEQRARRHVRNLVIGSTKVLLWGIGHLAFFFLLLFVFPVGDLFSKPGWEGGPILVGYIVLLPYCLITAIICFYVLISQSTKGKRKTQGQDNQTLPPPPPPPPPS
jgi:hypothetical protein